MSTRCAGSATSTSWRSPAAATPRRRKKADALGIERAYGSYEALLDDPDVQVVHNATPNYLHYPVNAAALAKGKHVVSDKPLAMTAAEARKLLDQATKAGVVHAVTFNYRGNPLVQQARLAIARGDIGTPHFLVGQYLQDWLLKDTDYSWRLEPDKGGASSALGDIGSHWCDLAQHVSGLRITARARRHHDGHPEAQAAEGLARGVPDRRQRRRVRSRRHRGRGPGVGAAALRQRRQGRASRSARSAPATRTIWSSRSAARRRRCAGRRNSRTISGSATATRPTRSCRRIRRCIDAEVRGYAHLPGGHQEAWADAFCNLMRDIYGFIAEGRKPADAHPPAFATFEDGYRANCIVEAILESAKKGSVWTEVEVLEPFSFQLSAFSRATIGDPLTALIAEQPTSSSSRQGSDSDDHPTVRTEVHESRRPDRGAAGAHAARSPRSRIPTRRSRTGSSSRKDLGAHYIQLSAALHPSESDVPPEAMLDPVANTLDLRQPFDKARAKRVEAAMKATGVGLSDIGYFDNLLHHDPAVRAKKHDFMLRVFDAAAAARRQRGLRVRRPQPAAQHGPEPDRLRGVVHSAAARRPRSAG